MTPVQFHEFDWLPEDALNGRTSLPKTSMLASMPGRERGCNADS